MSWQDILYWAGIYWAGAMVTLLLILLMISLRKEGEPDPVGIMIATFFWPLALAAAVTVGILALIREALRRR